MLAFYSIDPFISVKVFGRVESNTTQESIGQTALCVVSNSSGPPNIRFNHVGITKYRNTASYKNSANPKLGIHHQGLSITEIHHNGYGQLTCHVTDRLDTYNKTRYIPKTGNICSTLLINEVQSSDNVFKMM